MPANTKTLLTYNSQIINVDLNYYSPALFLPTLSNINLSSTYFFVGKVDSWDNETDPSQPQQDQASIKQIFKKVYGVETSLRYIRISHINEFLKKPRSNNEKKEFANSMFHSLQEQQKYYKIMNIEE